MVKQKYKLLIQTLLKTCIKCETSSQPMALWLKTIKSIFLPCKCKITHTSIFMESVLLIYILHSHTHDARARYRYE